MAVNPITVSQLNEYIGRIIGTDPLLGNVVVKGEISGLKDHSSGHMYFSIVDGFSKINCFLASSERKYLRYDLDDGMEVVITGRVEVYKKNGSYSLYVKDIEAKGEGSLAIAFAKMKEKLAKEGLFAIGHKKPIPTFPGKIGVITSGTGAAVRDILKIITSKNNFVDVTVFPVLVQGDQAARDISNMIDFVNENYNDIDVLIVGRGGGSAEDLWAFNEEILARSIYNSRIPIISAVGHEIDFTISDFVADARAETPTAAADMAAPDINELLQILEDRKDNLLLQLKNRLSYSRLDINNKLKEIRNEAVNKVNKERNNLEKLKLILSENNPEIIMDKGYSVLIDDKGKTITAAKSLVVGDKYLIKLKDGSASCTIDEVNYENR